jgi:3-hydroxyacyl-[acyl-carrier-protein] dehydratase
VRQVSRQFEVPGGHPAFPGHFPGRPVVPAALLLSIVLELARDGLGFERRASRWRRIKFLQPLGPDQPFTINLTGSSRAFRFSVELPDGNVLARGQCGDDALA